MKWTAEKLNLHRRIVSSFNFNPYLDFLAGIILSQYIEKDLWNLLPKVQEVNVIGPKNPPKDLNGFNIVADSALNFYEGRYHMVVTDLDGPADRIISSSKEGKYIIVHAHGDNIDKIIEHLPQLKGNVLGTTQSIPVRYVKNIGGFTDGDRSVLIAVFLGAKQINLYGFDFENPVDEPKDIKAKKMEFAREIIEKLKNIRIQYIQQ
jgi:Uncharacterized Rossmann fold enzyme